MIINDWIVAHPYWMILFFSIVVTLVSTLVQKKFTDQAHLKMLKDRQKELQKEIKNCKDGNLMKELNLEVMQITGKMMKSSMKPLLITGIPFLLLFSWLNGVYIPVEGKALVKGWWVWYYIGFSVVSSIFLRKALKVH